MIPTMMVTLKATAPKAIELRIHDRIGRDDDGRGIDSEAIAKALAEAGDVREITVRINSVGGMAFDGIAIHNLLRDHPAKVTVKIDGLAASAASLIAMAGDTIEMPASAQMLIHDPITAIVGDAKRLRSGADMLDNVKASAVGIYAQKSGQPTAKIAGLMEDETWLSAEEAKAIGFCDRITNDRPAAARMDLSAFSRVPPSVAALALPIASGAAGTPNAGQIALGDLDRYTSEFGAENGLKWLREGRSFAECVGLENARLRSELATIESRHATALQAERERADEWARQWSQCNMGEKTPVQTGNGEAKPQLKGSDAVAGMIRLAGNQ